MVTTFIHSLSLDTSKRRIAFSILQVLAASLFLALCSQICFPLYFSPVPLTGQTFGVMCIGATLGSRKGLLSILAYLAEGAMGLPVFAEASSGLLSLLGPTGGYFIGFACQAYLVGWFVERQTSFHSAKILPLLFLSCLLGLGLGALWLSLFVPFESALIMGVYPFLFGEFVKSFALTLCLKMGYKYSLLQ